MSTQTRRQRLVAALPIGLALLLIGGVWVAGAVWSFEEQTRYARANGFEIPQLLPLVLDGMAVAMAAVSWAASLDARPAVFARLVTGLAIAASSASNGAWAWTRSHGDPQTIVLAGGVPVVAMLAFEVLLAEVRRQVLRRRGQPGPVAITYPRLVRLVLAPWPTFVAWRRLVLEATDPAKAFTAAEPVHVEAEPVEVDQEPVDPWQWSTPVQPVPVHVEPEPVRTPPVRTPVQRSTRGKQGGRSTRSTSQRKPPPRVLAMVDQLSVDYPPGQPGPESVNAVVNRYGWRKQDATEAVRIHREDRERSTPPVHIPDSPADLDRIAV